MDKSKEKRKRKSLPSFKVYQRYLAQKSFLRSALWALLAMVQIAFIFLVVLAIFDTVTVSPYEAFQYTYDECLRVDNFTSEQCYEIAIAGATHGD